MSCRKYARLGLSRRCRAFSTETTQHRPVVKGVVSAVNPVPANVQRPNYAESGEIIRNHNEAVHDAATIVKLKRAGSLAAAMLKLAGKLVQPGVTTDWIDRQLHEAICASGAYPSPLNYMGFPKSVAVAVNEVICHGIPDDRVLLDGDVVSIDVSLYLDGVHGDNCGTWTCGEVDDKGVQLIEVSEQILHTAIGVCGPNVPLNHIGHTIETECDKYGYESVKEFMGHGIGVDLHLLP
jgi:methionyl aminopeptidase